METDQTAAIKPGYILPEAHRQAILMMSDSYQLSQKIELQRQAFCQMHGDDFGQQNNKKESCVD